MCLAVLVALRIAIEYVKPEVRVKLMVQERNEFPFRNKQFVVSKINQLQRALPLTRRSPTSPTQKSIFKIPSPPARPQVAAAPRRCAVPPSPHRIPPPTRRRRHWIQPKQPNPNRRPRRRRRVATAAGRAVGVRRTDGRRPPRGSAVTPLESSPIDNLCGLPYRVALQRHTAPHPPAPRPATPACHHT